ncbi:hypothetical protein [Streptomyces spectabilis]|uniref:Uncharacterized protein n=1 Tax=Streptomyces spectabilis TaxID=68270 RepID=A0A7W8ASW3_STRST|nr:hypothetical protein [Streptomyces spectabilis]MBB5102638.1 hypothetical protein [Streptomyces spectabilis]MCI3907676.1 hypothetical protein [Streptomyces spectabilis]GGV30654.1 hypothetical protein GCM10010245_49600 [Streptomyces spectabilis]
MNRTDLDEFHRHGADSDAVSAAECLVRAYGCDACEAESAERAVCVAFLEVGGGQLGEGVYLLGRQSALASVGVGLGADDVGIPGEGVAVSLAAGPP